MSFAKRHVAAFSLGALVAPLAHFVTLRTLGRNPLEPYPLPWRKP